MPVCMCVCVYIYMHAQLLQLCPTLQLQGLEPTSSSVYGISQARILKWVSMPSSRRFS